LISLEGEYLKLTPCTESSVVPYMNLLVESAHKCPNCGLIVQGIIPSLPSSGKAYDLHYWSDQKGVPLHAQGQTFRSKILTLQSGQKGQLFKCKYHFRDVALFDKSRSTEPLTGGSTGLCLYTNGIWEADSVRATIKITEEYRLFNWQYPDSSLRELSKKIRSEPEARKTFLDGLESLNLVQVSPDLVGSTGNVYLMRKHFQMKKVFAWLGITTK
jgi:hypothetical protein